MRQRWRVPAVQAHYRQSRSCPQATHTVHTPTCATQTAACFSFCLGMAMPREYTTSPRRPEMEPSCVVNANAYIIIHTHCAGRYTAHALLGLHFKAGCRDGIFRMARLGALLGCHLLARTSLRVRLPHCGNTGSVYYVTWG